MVGALDPKGRNSLLSIHSVPSTRSMTSLTELTTLLKVDRETEAPRADVTMKTGRGEALGIAERDLGAQPSSSHCFSRHHLTRGPWARSGQSSEQDA